MNTLYSVDVIRNNMQLDTCVSRNAYDNEDVI